MQTLFWTYRHVEEETPSAPLLPSVPPAYWLVLRIALSLPLYISCSYLCSS